MRARTFLVALGAIVLALASWLYVRGRREVESKMLDLRRQLREAEADADRRAREADARLLEFENMPPASGGAPPAGPTDFPIRDPEPPSPIKEFLRKDPKR